jgi:prepilin-type N-terminal cleavage/methylation domain-containing protein
MKRDRRGYALVEVLVSVVIVGALLAIFTLAASDSRRNASLSESINNLKQYAWAGSQYSAECNERFWTFSWTATNNPTGEPFATDLEAAAAQAVDIINRRTNLTMTPPSWIPHILYSHLVLADQLNLPLPLPWSVDPTDTYRMAWQRCESEPDPGACFLGLPLTQRPNEGSLNDGLRWMVSSSYQVGPAFISRDMGGGANRTLESALVTHYNFSTGNLPFGDRLMTQVAFPSRKVMMFDQFQRHFGGRIAYYAYPEARVALLLADGSAGVRGTSSSNTGFYPNQPAQDLPTRFNYQPRAWEPPTLSGAAVQLVTGYYQWTRGGLSGRDIGAREVCTGQPGCTP